MRESVLCSGPLTMLPTLQAPRSVPLALWMMTRTREAGQSGRGIGAPALRGLKKPHCSCTRTSGAQQCQGVHKTPHSDWTPLAHISPRQPGRVPSSHTEDSLPQVPPCEISSFRLGNPFRAEPGPVGGPETDWPQAWLAPTTLTPARATAWYHSGIPACTREMAQGSKLVLQGIRQVPERQKPLHSVPTL